MAYGSMVTGQLFSGDDTLSEKFFRATSDRVVGPVTRSLYTYDMHATSHAARDIVQVELPQGDQISTFAASRTEKVMCTFEIECTFCGRAAGPIPFGP